MRRPVMIHIREHYERWGHPRMQQILTQGVLIREEGLIRLEYQLLPRREDEEVLNASVMKSDPYWHITRPAFGADLVTLCPGQVCRNAYAGENGYLLDAIPVDLIWEETNTGGQVRVSLRCARSDRPYRSYSLELHYTTLS